MLVRALRAAAPTFPRQKGVCIRVATASSLSVGGTWCSWQEFLLPWSLGPPGFVFMFSPLPPPPISSCWGPHRGGPVPPCPLTLRAVVAPTSLERQPRERREGELAPTGSNWFQPTKAAPVPWERPALPLPAQDLCILTAIYFYLHKTHSPLTHFRPLR